MAARFKTEPRPLKLRINSKVKSARVWGVAKVSWPAGMGGMGGGAAEKKQRLGNTRTRLGQATGASASKVERDRLEGEE